MSQSPQRSSKLPVWKKPFKAIYLLQTIGPGIDIAELCGGIARATTLAVRRSLRAGPNFDLITGVDLNNREDQEFTKKYIDKHRVRTCGSNGTSMRPFRTHGRIRRICHS